MLARNGVAIIAKNPSSFVSSYSSYSGAVFGSSFALNDSDEEIALEWNDIELHSVSYTGREGAGGMKTLHVGLDDTITVLDESVGTVAFSLPVTQYGAMQDIDLITSRPGRIMGNCISGTVRATKGRQKVSVVLSAVGETVCTLILTHSGIVSRAVQHTFNVALTPSPARNITFTTIGQDAVDVSWDAPTSTGGSAVTYTVQYVTGNAQAVTVVSGSSLLTQRITGLSPNTQYTVRVIAVNRAGSASALEGVVTTKTKPSTGGGGGGGGTKEDTDDDDDDMEKEKEEEEDDTDDTNGDTNGNGGSTDNTNGILVRPSSADLLVGKELTIPLPKGIVFTTLGDTGSLVIFEQGNVVTGLHSFEEERQDAFIRSVSTLPINLPAPPVRFIRDLYIGDKGNDVRTLQQFLNTEGFIVAPFGVGSVGNENLFFDINTKRALARYQEAHTGSLLEPFGFTAGTGYFDAVTRGHVNRALFKKYESQVFSLLQAYVDYLSIK